jgi:hypothetical protein
VIDSTGFYREVAKLLISKEIELLTSQRNCGRISVMNKETQTMNLSKFDRERACFGCTIDDMKSSIDDAVRYTDYHMISMSMMSDAQEAMERKDYEWSRQLLNRAKWVLSTYQVRN